MNLGNILTEYLLGNFGDNSWLLWEGLKNKYSLYSNQDLGLYGYYNNSLITEPLTYYPFLFLSNFINSIFLWNFYIVLFLLVTFYFCYLLFKKTNSKFDSLLFSFLWLSNSYFSFHSREHLSLLAGFLFPIYLLIEDSNNKYKNYHKIFFLILSLAISNYIGVFLIFINFLFSIYKYIKNRNKENLINLYLSSGLCISLSIFLKLYFSNIQRNIENFTIFSFKPWHFLIQPERALVDLYNFELYFNNKNNILFNYFEVEHSTSFFGLTVFFIIGFLIWKKIKINTNYIFLAISTLLISLPPIVTFKGFNLYTPGYLFYFMFDQFRVTSRFNIFTFLVLLLIISSLFRSYENSLKNNFLKLIISIIIFLEIFVPFKITNIVTNQEIYKFIRENTPKGSILIIYPYEKTNIAFKDMFFIQRKIVNPYGYFSEENAFSSKEFTENLSCNQINKFNISNNDLYLINFLELKDIDLKPEKLNKIYEENGIEFYKVNCNE